MPTGIAEKKGRPRPFIGRGPEKMHYGNYVYAPLPEHDWDVIRRAKVRCKEECSHFDPIMGGCFKGLTPTVDCWRLYIYESVCW